MRHKLRLPRPHRCRSRDGDSTVRRDEILDSTRHTSDVDMSLVSQMMYSRQEVRNHVAKLMLRCTMYELFEWRFMQTDPN